MHFSKINKNHSFVKFSRRLFLFLFFFLTVQTTIKAQEINLDSLKHELQKEKNDSVKCMILSLLAEHSPAEEWQVYNEQLQVLAEKKISSGSLNPGEMKFFKRRRAAAIFNKGSLEYEKGNYKKAKELYDECLLVYEEQNRKEDIASVLQSLALIYQAQGEITKALDVITRSLHLTEKFGNKEAIANTLNSLGLLHDSQREYAKAIEEFNRSYKLCVEAGDKKGALYVLINIAFSYQNQENYPLALDYSLRSLKLAEEMGDKLGLAYALSNVGVLYSKYGDPAVTSSTLASITSGNNKAMEYFTRCLAIREEIGDKNGIAQSLALLANRYRELKNFAKAEELLVRAMKVSKEIGSPKTIMSVAATLSQLYKDKGNYSKALENYELSIVMRDSIRNEATKKASIKTQLKYEYEKLAAADSVAHAKESEIKNVELAKQKTEISAKKNQQYALFGGLGLVMIFAGFMYNRFKVMQKQKSIIEEQKEVVEEQKKLVEEKQKEILDSIKYARRIQLALIPTEKQLNKILEKLKL